MIEKMDVLATVRFGEGAARPAEGCGLVARVPNHPLAPGPREETWPSMGAAAPVAMDGVPAVADERRLFASVEAEAGPGAALETASFDLYRRLLRGLERAGYPHIVRMWNYVPRIHERTSDVDRYMLFCQGRAEAFASVYGDGFPSRLPAASGVGCPGDALVMHALASRDPVRHVENPRQVSAYRYPERYGPRSPSFARGTVTLGAGGGTLYVSGTAAIVGHESVFPGDPRRQTEETMRNIEAVLDAAGTPGRGEPLGLRLGSLRVYVRFPEQAGDVREALQRAGCATVPTVWLQGEICREELLVEIEATAPHPGPRGAPPPRTCAETRLA